MIIKVFIHREYIFSYLHNGMEFLSIRIFILYDKVKSIYRLRAKLLIKFEKTKQVKKTLVTKEKIFH